MKSLLMKPKNTYLLLPVLLALASSSFAATYYVGTCHASSYPTITAAVAAVPPNSTVDVCPGTYPEQVFISQPLTLQGIKSGNADRARIVVPSLVSQGVPNGWQFVPDPDPGWPPGFQDAPQIFVTAPTGTVKISNLTIDASGETAAPACAASGFWFTTAIMYQDSSGTVNEVNTVGQGKNSGCGVGIRATAVATSSNSVTISNNSIQDATEIGVYVESIAAGASLKINVSGNTLALTGNSLMFPSGIRYSAVTGTISSNFISSNSIVAPFNGITESGVTGVGPVTISNNVLHASSPNWGMQVGDNDVITRTVSGNKIVGFDYGIGLFAYYGTNRVKSNTIVNSLTAIDLRCSTDLALSGNIVNNAAIGIDFVPGGVLPAGVSFYNVDQVMGSGSCP